MRIAIDASRTTVAHATGTERYSRELIRALIPMATDHQITLYFREQPPPDLFPPAAHVTHKVIPLRRLWTHIRFAAAIWRDRPDLVFSPAHTLPFLFPGRAAVTVHDLGYRHFPEMHPFKVRVLIDLMTRWSVRRSSIVLADSISTAADLSRFYGTSSAKVRVVYLGVTALPTGDIDAVRDKFTLPTRYFIFVSTLQPHKNITRLVEAFAKIRADFPDVGLILAGRPGWKSEPLWSETEGVTMTGYVTDKENGALLAGAVALVYPSLFEGFGLPVVEAMLAGTPVVASSSSSLPEVAGEAALLPDPCDTDAIAAAMRRMLTDENLRTHLVTEGKKQAARFTWEATARATLSALEDAVK